MHLFATFLWFDIVLFNATKSGFKSSLSVQILCGHCKLNAFISKEEKVVLIGHLPGNTNRQVMHCELGSSGAFLAAKHLKLGVPYT